MDHRLKALRGQSRRDFLRWGTAVAAAVGLERARFLDVLNDTAGTAAADMAQCNKTNRHIHVVDGDGGLSNWTLAFPVPAVVKGTNQNFSHPAVGQGTDATGYDRPFAYVPDSPWQQNSTWRMSAFLGGRNEAHTGTPNTVLGVGTSSMLAAAASIQQANPTLLPVLTVGNVPYGTAAGAPADANVESANQLVGLFNSAASKALLAGETNGPLAESYYKAFLGLNAAAGRSTVAKSYGVGKVSMNLLAKNLSNQLTPTTADLQVFGIDGNTSGAVQAMARSMITTVKAFSLGLTSMLVMRGFNNDPHGLFGGGNNDAARVSASIGKMMNGLHTLAKSLQDPGCSSKTLADALVFSVSGDTFKQPFARDGWDDGTPGGSNLLYVMGGGYVKTGWFGELVNGNTVRAWDIATGNTNAGMDYGQARGALGAAAGAAALFAVARGDMRRVRDFYNGAPIDGIVNLDVTG